MSPHVYFPVLFIFEKQATSPWPMFRVVDQQGSSQEPIGYIRRAHDGAPYTLHVAEFDLGSTILRQIAGFCEARTDELSSLEPLQELHTALGSVIEALEHLPQRHRTPAREQQKRDMMEARDSIARTIEELAQ